MSLRLRAPLLAVTGTPATFSGQTVSAVASVPEQAAFTCAAAMAGATIAVSVSAIPGGMTGAALFSGELASATASVLAGAMIGGGASVFSGQVVQVVASIIKGAMTGGGGSSVVADPAAVWDYELAPGVTAGQMLAAAYGMISTIHAKIGEIHKLQGLDATAPVAHTPATITAGDVQLELTGDGIASRIVTRKL